MPKLLDVFEFVSKKLVLYVNDNNEKKQISDFLGSLLNSTSNQCHRLLICLGIDFKAISLNYGDGEEIKNYCTEIIKVIKLIYVEPLILRGSTTKLAPSILFGVKLKKNVESFVPPIQGDKYSKSCRIVPFSSFINPNYNPSILSNHIFPHGLSSSKEKIAQLITDINNGDKDLSKIELKGLTSSTGWVFFTKRDELNKEIDNKNLPAVIDYTGYYISSINFDEEYIAINYPDNFDEIVFQPCSLTGDWGKLKENYEFIPGNDFFVTFKYLDTWGRTCSVSNCCNEVSERVHTNKDFQSKTYSFNIQLMGKLKTNIISRDSSTIIDIALDRYKNS